jgi:hypothetical protein
MAVNHPLPMSQTKEYEVNGNPVNLDKVFEVNEFTYKKMLEILGMEVGDSMDFADDKTLKRVD